MYVCTTCSLGQSGFLDELKVAMDDLEIEGIDCMSGCTRDQTVAFRAPGKVAYLFGEITADDVPDLKRFVALYRASTDGSFADARVLGGLRHKAVARIPG